jgi:hypothetical protein
MGAEFDATVSPLPRAWLLERMDEGVRLILVRPHMPRAFRAVFERFKTGQITRYKNRAESTDYAQAKLSRDQGSRSKRLCVIFSHDKT